MLRKVLLIIAACVIVAAAALAIFLATFNIDQFRPQVVAQLVQTLNRPVAISRLSLGWRNGVAVACEGLVISDDQQAQREPLLQMKEASAQVALMPLFRKSIQVSSVLLREPQIHVARDAQGQINVTGLAAVASPAAAGAIPATQPSSPAPAVPQVDVKIDSLRIVNGTVHWTDEGSQLPMELWVRALDVRITNIAPGRPMDIEARAALASATQNLHVTGLVTLPTPSAQGSVEQLVVALEGLQVEGVLPKPAGPQDSRLLGKLTVRVRGELPTLQADTLMKTATMEGNVQLAEGTIVNLNVLRLVLDRLSILPGLMETLLARLPPHYQETLAQQDTTLLPIDLPFTVAEGRAALPKLHVKTDTFGFTGAGTVGLDGALEIRGAIQVESELSSAMVRSVSELQALANREGELEMPLLIQGQAPRIVVTPDVNYVASRVATAAAAGLLGQVLQRMGERSGAAPAQEGAAPQASDGSPAAPSGEPTQPAQEDPYRSLGVLLGRALAPQQQAPADGSQN